MATPGGRRPRCWRSSRVRAAGIAGRRGDRDLRQPMRPRWPPSAAWTRRCGSFLRRQRSGELAADLSPRLVREFVVEAGLRRRSAGSLGASPAARRSIGWPINWPQTSARSWPAGPPPGTLTAWSRRLAKNSPPPKWSKSLSPQLYRLSAGPLREAWLQVGGVLGIQRPTLFSQMYDFIQQRRRTLWQQRLRGLNYELLDQAPGAYDWHCLDACRTAAKEQGLWTGPAKTAEARRGPEAVPRGAGRPLCPRAAALAEEQRRTASRDGQRGANARLGKHLDPADHQPHRHAGHRRADADRREGLRRRPGEDQAGFRGGGRRCCGRCPARWA